MEIRFFLTGQDVWNFQKYALVRPRVLVPLIALVVIVLSIVFLTTLIGPISSTNTLFNGLFFIILLVLICLVVVRFRWRMTRGATRRLAAQGEHVITISPEGFRHKNNLSDSMTSWQAIKEIRDDAYNLYFMVDSNVTMAHVIPRRAFASPQAADMFLAWAKSYWAYGHGMQRPGSPGSATGYERWG
ncbi:MAG TPA: YcxB family protein [Ktedonobacterales bacterium]|nr:YcxB family protein [Ktedonobacterales bacterium]